VSSAARYLVLELAETHGRNADEQAGIAGSLVGVKPQYRYEIVVVPQGDHASRIIVNVRTQDMSDATESISARSSSASRISPSRRQLPRARRSVRRG
jgi:hypothetical protein